MKPLLILTALVFSCFYSFGQWVYPSSNTIYYTGGNVGIGTATPTAPLSIVGGPINLGTNTGQFNLAGVDDLSTTPLPTGVNMMGLFSGDLMFRSFWGVSIDLNDGLLGDNENATNSRITGTSSFTINSRISSHYFNTLFTVRNNGNVLIGKTTQSNSGYKLDVNGTIRSNEIVVNTSGADYVFQPSYSLMPLSTLKTYLNQYHHLPEIPSASEMQHNGLNVGENQINLLKKIEELSLYAIDADSRIKKDEKLIAEQQEVLIELKEQIEIQKKAILVLSGRK